MSVAHQTFDGEEMKAEEITHQHASNIYWYNKFLDKYAQMNTERQVRFAKELLFSQFDNVILPYRPVRRFNFEIRFLLKNGRFHASHLAHKKYQIWFEDGKPPIGEFYNNYILSDFLKKIF